MKKFLFFLAGSSLLLFGCGKKAEEIMTEAETATASSLLQHISEAQKAREETISARTVGISLEKAVVENGTLTFEIWLDNPEGRPISSVRSFLAFDPKSLSGTRIEIPLDSPFSTAAPNEKDFDSIRGLAKIGLAASSPSREKSILLARVVMERLTPQFTTIDFYDPGTDGHTAVLEKISDGTFRNILTLPPVPGLVLPPKEKP